MSPPIRKRLNLDEIRVIQLLAEGASDKMIARALFITEHSVRARIRMARRLLGAHNRTHLVYRAVSRNFIEQEKS